MKMQIIFLDAVKHSLEWEKKVVLQNDAKFETKERLERKSISRGKSRLLL